MINVLEFLGVMVIGIWGPELFMTWRDRRAERRAK